ncbi:site-2 protease family protein [Campylobacter sp. CCUG 57310]|uniref:site-2 protease family protein n=1 Tax=Campylobacter sp. CCUG 57310 TaxID=2517362 RepID=UPI00156455F4|nr:site-2 protease family protein [Campylobacter sp. CCUG 57310]QKF92490.1 membrane-associated zinc metalloprotease, S2P/M50 family [Campylobacter sp. CCUG 57310]
MSTLENIDIVEIATLVVALTIAIVGHEIAHGFVAYKFGDETAKNQNRLSINPIRHVDPLGTIIVPALLYLSTGFVIGWAKPVPVNTYTVIRNGGYKAAILVSLAGIIYNFILAILAFFAIKSGFVPSILIQFFFMLMAVNLILGMFNLYPIPPLDGSKALEYLFRMLNLQSVANLLSSAQKYGMIVLVIIVISPISQQVFYPIRYAFALFRNML